MIMNLMEISRRKDRIAETITWILFSVGITYIFATIMMETYGI